MNKYEIEIPGHDYCCEVFADSLFVRDAGNLVFVNGDVYEPVVVAVYPSNCVARLVCEVPVHDTMDADDERDLCGES